MSLYLNLSAADVERVALALANVDDFDGMSPSDADSYRDDARMALRFLSQARINQAAAR